MKKTRHTRQRGVILDILRSDVVHLTAEEVYQRARKALPGISLGTVYRNLNFLCGQGFAREVHLIGYDTLESDAVGNAGDHLFFDEECFLRGTSGRFQIDKLIPGIGHRRDRPHGGRHPARCDDRPR